MEPTPEQEQQQHLSTSDIITPANAESRQKDPTKLKNGNQYDLATRAQMVTLSQYTALSNMDISKITGAHHRQVQRFVNTAKERGWSKEQPLKVSHVQNKREKPRGRPRKPDQVGVDGMLCREVGDV